MTQSPPLGDTPTSELSKCSRCGMEVLTSELWAHTAHAHNVDLDVKKQKKNKTGGRDRGRR